MPASTVIDNIDTSDVLELEGAAKEVIANFDLRTPLADVLAIYRYAKRQETQPAA